MLTFICFRNVDDIDDLKQGMNEQIDNANEISNALSREIGDPTPDDVSGS